MPKITDLTIEDCDKMVAAAFNHKKLRSPKKNGSWDDEVDRWLDQRLHIMKETEELDVERLLSDR